MSRQYEDVDFSAIFGGVPDGAPEDYATEQWQQPESYTPLQQQLIEPPFAGVLPPSPESSPTIDTLNRATIEDKARAYTQLYVARGGKHVPGLSYDPNSQAFITGEDISNADLVLLATETVRQVMAREAVERQAAALASAQRRQTAQALVTPHYDDEPEDEWQSEPVSAPDEEAPRELKTRHVLARAAAAAILAGLLTSGGIGAAQHHEQEGYATAFVEGAFNGTLNAITGVVDKVKSIVK